MRYRKLSPSGDYQFGYGASFLVNTPETVAQAVRTRMALYAEEWFLDKREGLDRSLILGYGTQGTRDQEMQRRILETPGVLKLVSYGSQVSSDRGFTVAATIDTIYGTTTLEEVIR